MAIKMLHCPKCHKENHLTAEDAKFICKYNKRNVLICRFCNRISTLRDWLLSNEEPAERFHKVLHGDT